MASIPPSSASPILAIIALPSHVQNRISTNLPLFSAHLTAAYQFSLFAKYSPGTPTYHISGNADRRSEGGIVENGLQYSQLSSNVIWSMVSRSSTEARRSSKAVWKSTCCWRLRSSRDDSRVLATVQQVLYGLLPSSDVGFHFRIGDSKCHFLMKMQCTSMTSVPAKATASTKIIAGITVYMLEM
ncbi:uncharacterized protein M421DRAFT_90469 [Didymella exigua CBS 183.55]|uniref:Uncharacterized protein n=1 Tax=Didymella exigua CBS 183.55 TaxID=1150837 RepID=A0A6A5RUA5_9PLEO|nr:uncharacterized protein M421DRAFT_90469 [Didymella exigua CBS 183.55]KAF1931422.1 hypothetical protein M421DRAFT_90469 [Didymella exigua CBS 183.55]